MGTTYIGSTSYTSTPFNGCATNPSGPFAAFGIGYDPAIGYTPVDPSARYIVAGGGALTNVGRNSFRSPGFGVLNLSIFKNTHFTESKYLQVRAEFFNVLNHANYAISNGNVFNTAGITTALSNPQYVLPFDPDFLNPKKFSGGQRTVTLGLKFIF